LNSLDTAGPTHRVEPRGDMWCVWVDSTL